MSTSKSIGRCSFLLAVFIPLAAHGGSFSLSEQSASGLGSAYAGGAAQAEDASTLFFNPAGLARLDQGELQLGAHFIIPSASFTNHGSRYELQGTPFDGLPLGGGNGGDGGVARVLPDLYLTQPIFRNPRYGNLSVGVGFSAPFGLETDYEPGWVGRYSALRTKLSTLDIQPTVAYRLFDCLSLGASLDVQYASARVTQAIDFGLAAQPLLGQFYAGLPDALAAQGVPPPLIAPTIAATQQAYADAGFLPGGRDGVGEVQGEDWSVGFTLGALLEYRKANEESFFREGRFGVSYRSAIDHTLGGTGEFRTVPAITAPGAPVQFPVPGALQSVFFDQDASAQLNLPDILHFSIYQRFAQEFAVMGDIAWTHWSRLQNVPITFANPDTPATVLEIKYDNATRYSLGFEWYVTRALTLRTGFAYDETPIQSAEFRTPRIPDNDRYILAAGLRWSASRWMDFDIGYSHFFLNDSQSNLPDVQGHKLIGRYTAEANVVAVSVTIRWGGDKGPKADRLLSNDTMTYRK